MKACVYIPIKTTNERFPNKTFANLDGKPLYSYLFNTVKSLGVDVYIDSSDEGVLNLAREWGFKALKRPERYNENDIAGDDLLKRVIDEIDGEIILFLHITCPFLTAETIKEALSSIESDSQLDSLLGVVPKFNRFWFKNMPINHDTTKLMRTQDLIPIHEEADFYLVKKDSFKRYEKRVCGNIKTIEIKEIEGVDIDTRVDLLHAESLIRAGLVGFRIVLGK